MRVEFSTRHIGPDAEELRQMLDTIGISDTDRLIEKIIPKDIFFGNRMKIPEGVGEHDLQETAKKLASRNRMFDNFIGQGYYGTIMPSVIRRNILENPGWYTAYTPYQAEISQGRLEMLLNFQHMVADLTAMEIANASLLDEASAAAEAMMMARRINPANSSVRFFVDKNLHPQIFSVLTTRAEPLGITLEIGKIDEYDFDDCFGAIFAYPDTFGEIRDLSAPIEKAKARSAITIIATDLLALTHIKPPGEMGADIVIGSTQRFGVPMGFGGPHAAFLATRKNHQRSVPGRIIGLSKDAQGAPAMRMSLQTREQHIRRERATSNICTAQALPAILAAAYAIYHGPDGLRKIAATIHQKTRTLAQTLEHHGFKIQNRIFFDTLTVRVPNAENLYRRAQKSKINLRFVDEKTLGIALDETTKKSEIKRLLKIFNIDELSAGEKSVIPAQLSRSSAFLNHPVFHQYRSETEMMRYLTRLEKKDIALNRSMIPLGSCTMKLNAATEMETMTLDGFANLHPFAPNEQTKGYQKIFTELEKMLVEVSGYDAFSLQPNAGSQGELAGLLAIKNYHRENQENRDICLIPTSAHGTNPASAVAAGMRVVAVRCLENGNIDIENLREKITEHGKNLAAIMITYPSTHGVFETDIAEICNIVHAAGGQVYLDGANLNAMVGLTRMGEFGADVSHINLHKTFSIPHGGGGPGMGPVGVRSHLRKFLPGDPLKKNSGAVAATMFGSASILPISWAYIKLLGKTGMQRASEVAIVSANYIAARLDDYYPVRYRGQGGLVAHECIIDLRSIFEQTGISEEDIAKRLIDYGFHAPTISFPVAKTLMIEPTESESKREIDRFIDAMINIHAEIERVRNGSWDALDNPLKNAPHTALELAGEWTHPYTRMTAFYPQNDLQTDKYFPPVKRVDNAFGDRNLVCQCPPVEAFAEKASG